MAENNEELVNSRSSQLGEDDLQKLEPDSLPENTKKQTMAGGEMHVSFAASRKTHSVHQLYQTVSLLSTLTNRLIVFFFMSFIIFDNTHRKIL